MGAKKDVHQLESDIPDGLTGAPDLLTQEGREKVGANQFGRRLFIPSKGDRMGANIEIGLEPPVAPTRIEIDGVSVLKENVYDLIRSYNREVEQAILGLAKACNVEKSLADDFKKQAKIFLKSYFERANERTPPSIPSRKYDAKSDHIIEFLQTVWAEWLVRGLLTKSLLRSEDRSAHTALQNYLRTHDLPDGMEIPNQTEVTDRFLSRGLFTLDEVHRASGALNRRAA